LYALPGSAPWRKFGVAERRKAAGDRGEDERQRAGPAPGRLASPAAAVPIVAKMPAPMIAPMPSMTTSNAPRTRRN
jgi:hypothetical protein